MTESGLAEALINTTVIPAINTTKQCSAASDSGWGER